MHTNNQEVIDRSQWWRTAGYPPPNTVPLNSTYDSRKQVKSPVFELPYGKEVSRVQT